MSASKNLHFAYQIESPPDREVVSTTTTTTTPSPVDQTNHVSSSRPRNAVLIKNVKAIKKPPNDLLKLKMEVKSETNTKELVKHTKKCIGRGGNREGGN